MWKKSLYRCCRNREGKHWADSHFGQTWYHWLVQYKHSYPLRIVVRAQKLPLKMLCPARIKRESTELTRCWTNLVPLISAVQTFLFSVNIQLLKKILLRCTVLVRPRGKELCQPQWWTNIVLLIDTVQTCLSIVDIRLKVKKTKKTFKDAVYFRDWVGVGWGSRGEVMCRFPCWVNMALSISIVPPTTRKLVGIRLKLACTCFLQKDCLVKGGIKRKTVGEPRSMLSWYCATSRCRSEPPNGYPAVSKWLTKTAYKARPRGRQGYRTERNWPHYPSF